MDSHVAKPVRMEALAEELDRFLHPAPAEPLASTPLTPEPTPDAGLLDPQVIAHLRSLSSDDGPDPLAELRALFMASAPQLTHTLRAAAAAGDTKATLIAVHTLKGSAASLGANELAALCARIEESARTHALDHHGPLLDELDEQTTAVEAALDRLVGDRADATRRH
jgi:HPt (histidine-containing phosphotransfer) domain-containing protein